MKRTIKVTGVGHKKGVSKANKPYDFHVVSGIYEDPDYTSGFAACEFAVDDSMMSGVEVDKCVHVIFHYYNGKIYVNGVMPA